MLVVRGEVKRQIRGGSIGSPLSPAWCVATVIVTENHWLTVREVPRALQDRTWLTLRYVDNRMMLSFRKGEDLLTSLELLDNMFYGETIILEEEPKNTLIGAELIFTSEQFVGDIIGNQAVQTRLVVPGYVKDAEQLDVNELWRYRTSMSSGSRANHLAPMLTRLHMAQQLSWPRHRARQAIARIVWVYLQLGFPTLWIFRTLCEFCRKKLVAYPTWWIDRMETAIFSNWMLLHPLCE